MSRAQVSQGHGVRPGPQAVEIVAGRVVVAGVQIDRLHRRAVNGDFDQAAKAVGSEANPQPGAVKGKFNGVADFTGARHLAVAGLIHLGIDA